MLDNSQFKNEEYFLLKSNVDVFINPIENDKLKYYTDECIYKAYGELNQTKLILDFILYFVDKSMIEINHLFKISGRYKINENFDYNKFNNVDNNFKLNENVTNRKYYYTSFYKISNVNYENYHNVINSLINDLNENNNYDNVDYEVFFPPKLNQISLIDNLGITQNVSVWNDKSSI